MFAAATGIESQNIVGYQQKASLGNNYFKFVVPTFNVTDGGTMKLKDLALVYDGDDASSQNIWTLTQGGATKDAYYYVNEAAAETEEVAVGWYADTTFTTSADDVPVPFGQGFALVATDESTKILFKGKVETAEFVDITGGGVFNFTGNFSPKTAQTLSDIALVYDGDGASSQNIWTLTQGGATKDAYYYVNEAAAETEEVAVGWYTDTTFTTSANDVPLEPGDGFAVVASDAIQLKVSSAL